MSAVDFATSGVGELVVWPTWARWISSVCRLWPSTSNLRWTSLPRETRVGGSTPVKTAALRARGRAPTAFLVESLVGARYELRERVVFLEHCQSHGYRAMMSSR